MRNKIRNILREANSPKRFRPESYHAFRDPITADDGTSIIGYEWEYEWIETVDKRGEDIQIRVSDWSKAQENPKTGRMIVHLFHVRMPDGSVIITSAEKASEMVGIPVRKIRNAVDKQMRIEDKERSAHETKKQMIAGTAQLTPVQAKKEWSKLSSDERIETYLQYMDRHPELLNSKLDDRKLFSTLRDDEPRHTFATVSDFRSNLLSYIREGMSRIERYGFAKDKGQANALFWSRFQNPSRTTYNFQGKDIPIIDESYFMYHPDGRIMRVHDRFDKAYIPFFEYLGFHI